jgi:ABC-type transport system involved in cytochrome bd biosynthesis fused ATPase/permease subunit
MKDMFEVENEKAPGSQNEALEKTKQAANLKEELAKESKLIQWSIVREVLIDKTIGMLDIPVLIFLSPAWKKYKEIMEFADTNKYPPNETELVSLADHSITVEHHPYLQVTYRGVALKNAKLTFTLEAELIVQGVVLKIQNGKIIAIEAGTVKGNGKLLLEDQLIMNQEFGSYRLPGRIDVGDGISLSDTSDSHAAVAGES